jgi:putative OPT family oligopeptide transporter
MDDDTKPRVLPENAYTPLKKGEDYVPYVPPGTIIPEVTVRSVTIGLIMAFIFTAAAAYLGLYIGQVFEAAIPIAILAVGMGTLYKRKSTIAENVIIQSIGAASGVVVAGAIFTLPALYILNLTADFYKFFVASLLGGIFGVVFLIPLRRYFCKDQHGILPFPEATATTEVLVTGDQTGGGQALTLLIAAAVGGLYDFLFSAFGFWKEVISTRILPFGVGPFLHDKLRLLGTISTRTSILGLGYIIGFRYSAIICAGSFLSWFILVPTLWYFGQHIDFAIAPGTTPIKSMTAVEIFRNYVRHIGIGGIACAGIIGIIKNLNVIVSAFSLGFKEIFSGKKETGDAVRTDRDLRMSTILGIIGVTAVALFAFFFFGLGTQAGFAVSALLLATVIAFLFTTVAARATALVGSNPVSGMTLMTLILSSFLLVQIGLKGTDGMMVALLIGTVVCTALSVAGGFITDLKIGYWLGTSPRNQERLKFAGILVAALACGLVILLLNSTYGFVKTDAHPNPMPAPQANAMAAVLTPLFSPGAQAPWLLYLAGMLMALTMELIGVAPLAFALGMYLPLEVNTPLLLGGVIALLISRSSRKEGVVKARADKGTLIASGFIAGGAIMGVVSAILEALFRGNQQLHILREGRRLLWTDTSGAEILSTLLFIGFLVFFYYYSKSGAKEEA